MVVLLELSDEDGYRDRDSVGDDLRAGQHQQQGWFLHGGNPMATSSDSSSLTAPTSSDSSSPTAPTSRHQETETSAAGFSSSTGADRDGDFVKFLFLSGAELARPRNGGLVGAFLLLHGARPRNSIDIDALFDPSPETGRARLLLHVGVGERDEDGDGGEELGARARLLPDWDVGDGDLLHHQHGNVDEVCATHYPLRLRGGAADYYPAAAPPAFSWVGVMGLPMVQTIPGTCALVAATVCMEAQHRRKFEAEHGAATFACRAAAPRKLRQACFREKEWNPSTGKDERTWDPEHGVSDLRRVLRMMKRLGGARTTNAAPPAPFFLPLEDWERYGYDDGGLTAETAARLIYESGPCIGTLFTTTLFFDSFVIPGSKNPPAVFRGCPREDREEVEANDPAARMHAVVCFAYRRSSTGRLCIFILDNERASGPVRCVDFEEFDAFYVLYVEALSDPSNHLLRHRDPPLLYPVSGY